MRVIVDINHPAHAHFFKYPIRLLRDRGHEVLVASRIKDVTTQLLDELQIEHVILSAQTTKGVVSLATELVQRDWRLYRLVKKWKADCLTAIGGTFTAHTGVLTRTPSIVFYDTENARLQNFITYPFVSRLYVPRCYAGPLPRNATRYPGYHELAYLHPAYFTPDRLIARQNGLAPSGPTFVVRTLAWLANHDIGNSGWSTQFLIRVIDLLSTYGKVLISAEGDIPNSLEHLRYVGTVTALHHIMAFSALYIGESATMASECAVLGVPSLYIAKSSRGYTTEQQQRYGLVHHMPNPNWKDISHRVHMTTTRSNVIWSHARQRLLSETIDVTALVVQAIEGSSAMFWHRHNH